MNKPTQEDAQVVFPNFAREDRLKSFLSIPLKGKGGIPQPFRDFCQAALDGQELENDPQPAMTIKRNGHTAHFIEASYMNITAQTLKNSIPNYQGVNLIIANLHKVSTLYLKHLL